MSSHTTVAALAAHTSGHSSASLPPATRPTLASCWRRRRRTLGAATATRSVRPAGMACDMPSSGGIRPGCCCTALMRHLCSRRSGLRRAATRSGAVTSTPTSSSGSSRSPRHSRPSTRRIRRCSCSRTASGPARCSTRSPPSTAATASTTTACLGERMTCSSSGPWMRPIAGAATLRQSSTRRYWPCPTVAPAASPGPSRRTAGYGSNGWCDAGGKHRARHCSWYESASSPSTPSHSAT